MIKWTESNILKAKYLKYKYLSSVIYVVTECLLY